jgi:transcriptional regulator with XRE-family HTH domain
MTANDTIKRIIKKSGKTQQEIADLMEISKKTLDTKFYRGGFYADELIQLGNCLGLKLAFINNEQNVVFDLTSDNRNTKQPYITLKERFKDFKGNYEFEEWNTGENVGIEVFE